MAYTGEAMYLAESKSFTAGGKVQVSLRDLPPGRVVTKILVSLEVAITQPSSGPTAILGNALWNLFALVILGDKIRATGSYFRVLNWQMRGKMFETPAGIPATNSFVGDRELAFVIPFADKRSHEPNDTARNTELFRDTPLEITFGALPTGVSTITGSLRTIIFHEPADAGVIHTEVLYNYEDWSQDDVILRPGVYTDVFVFNEDGTTIADTVLVDATVYADGELIIPKIQGNELARYFNWQVSEGANVYTASATAPVGGEELEDRPANTTGAGAGVTMNWVPILAPRERYKLTKALDVQNALRVIFTGTATAFRVGYRSIQPHSADSVARTASRLGVPNPIRALQTPGGIRAKTASKAGRTSGRQNRLLPVKFGPAPSPAKR